MKTLTDIAEILAQHGHGVLRNYNAPNSICLKIENWLNSGDATQLNLPDKPFNEPSGRAYVGPGRGTVGYDNSYANMSWGSTYDGCRSWEMDIAKSIITLSIYDGDSFDGKAVGLRGKWEFQLNFDWPHYSDFSRAINNEWKELINEKFDEEEQQRVAAAKGRIASNLLLSEFVTRGIV